jgi:hypothetical protein
MSTSVNLSASVNLSTTVYFAVIDSKMQLVGCGYGLPLGRHQMFLDLLFIIDQEISLVI